VAALKATLHHAIDDIGGRQLHTISVGAPGLIDPRTGQVTAGGSELARHQALIEALRRQPDLPQQNLLVENEANLAGIAEHRLGAAVGRDTFVLLWLGDGVGAATVLDGKLRRGASGGAGELGFLPVPGTSGLPTATGCGGGLHDLVAATAVLTLAAKHGVPSTTPPPRTTRSTRPQAGEAANTVAAATAANDRCSAAFLDVLAANIALGVAAVSAVLDPGYVALGGPIGRAGGPALAERVTQHVRRLSPQRTEVVATTVTGNDVLQGAVLVALDAARAHLFGTD
jgi:predicted NBD/HSP70 family sugar kinase